MELKYLNRCEVGHVAVTLAKKAKRYRRSNVDTLTHYEINELKIYNAMVKRGEIKSGFFKCVQRRA